MRASIDGTAYALNDADGWILEGDKTVTFQEGGAACNELRDGDEHDISIQVECQPVQVK